MTEAESKLQVETEEKAAQLPAAAREWRPLGTVWKELDRLVEELHLGSWRLPFARGPVILEPLFRSEISWGPSPVVDVVEREQGYEITAELPGIDPGNIEIKLSNGALIIKGEKTEVKEEKKKEFFVAERRWGSFQRSFRIPEGVDKDKVEATFSNGVLTVILPKTVEARKEEKTIAIKTS